MMTPPKINATRLLKLADLLLADARRKNGIKFNLGVWGEVKNPDDVLSCGTEGCAFGLAAMSGAFKRAGLGFELGPQVGATRDVKILWKGELIPALNAAENVFGLTREEAKELFGGSDGGAGSGGRGAASERAVAKRIRKLVKAVQNLKKGDPRELALDRFCE
jgi:hypothetical protein